MTVKAPHSSQRSSDHSSEYVIVGGGVHGTYFARELVESGVDHEAITILDSHGELLGAFRDHARACGMDALRSTYVQHVGSGPFSLETFASTRDREGELLSTRNHPNRPTLSLFLDHVDRVVDRFDLDELLIETTVTGIERKQNQLVLTSRDRQHRADTVILAIGHGNRYRRPDWACGIDSVEHVWDDEMPPETDVDGDERLWVVGGGATAGQYAISAAAVGANVTLCTRSRIETAQTEADPRWLNWRRIEDALHAHPPGSKARCDCLREAHNSGTMPPYVERTLRETDSVTIRRGQIESARPAGDECLLTLANGDQQLVDRVVLATGFEHVWEHPFVERVAESLGLRTGYRSMPILDDETLAWKRVVDRPSRLFATGALAAGSIGPFAGTIAGARRATERVLGTDRTERHTGQLA